MGKFKRIARKQTNHHQNPRAGKESGAGTKPDKQQKHSQLPSKAPVTTKSPQQARQKVQFSKYDNVLLVGEGDFSFALSLVKNHRFHHLVATCYDSADVLHNKYPNIDQTIKRLVPVDVLTSSSDSPQTGASDGYDDNEDEWGGLSPSEASSEAQDTDLLETESKKQSKIQVLYGIDATKLSSAHSKTLRSSAPYTKIVFNFPHVGGLSTDVNRQVRYNQELLVGFFKAAKGLLSTPSRPARVAVKSDQYSTDDEGLSDEPTTEEKQKQNGAISGQILVTLFEGEPYTLWNIRDLARHSGLKVVESFAFPWSAYPGYRHARTIGDITHGKDRADEGKRKGAWRGEERDARCYVLEDKAAMPAAVRIKKRKRKLGEEEDGDSE
ncbi:hypothetical protein PV10_05776 [Exophiala mesophila]|uniref:25S rRNA (uridine-N(3))-methyltransferase BMT5-like domain-containing protein n=1 Tax=Exophiala mesophila TaxID=212818 RepID=A0A0D1ZB50_EXOME|nr:uncharacterized protein PV10_05776 [Exophiala mesophila]KIV91214.1 hypothetical protein PV10_05776 [Exophiala mesophila]